MNQFDKEYMKMAMLKHEETFREQVFELHRLHRIQKMLMKDMEKNARMDRSSTTTSTCNGPEPRPEQAGESVGKCGVPETGYDDQTNLELTLGPRSFYEKKVSGPTTGSRSPSLKWGPETPVSNSPPWLFHALSLNMT
ncbi:hypothetical protein SASPL_142057 [Salvia splendens]|uniref:Uncharacterized protein n=1 Tax=Salvia splendens TaxID=180675 RepID=A0A8X8Z9G4_SALSN|nr:uncharacterized protein LOC121770827 [Salvia splendens]KAG6395924.1 hypothetical protein SASPL_142057 [Salvia splendens]